MATEALENKSSGKNDEISLAYHSLRKVFILKDKRLEEGDIEPILSGFDNVFSKQLVNLDSRYNKEECFIHRLARESQVKLLQQFINIGCNVNVQSKDGSTAAHYIVQIGDSDATRQILTMLFENGADFSIQNETGFSSIDLAGYKLSKFMENMVNNENDNNGDNNEKRHKRYSFSENDISQTFNILDRTNNGLLSLAELRDTLSKLEMNISDDLLDYMFNMVDFSGDGQVSLDEFNKFVKTKINNQLINEIDINNEKQRKKNNLNKYSNAEKMKNISIDFIFEPRNHINNDNFIDVDNIGKVLQKCQITNNFTKLNRLFKTYFAVETNNAHSYANWENFYNAFKSKARQIENDENKERKHKKRLKRIFYSFSEENSKLVNGRLLFICLAGVAAQFPSGFTDKQQLIRLRSDFIFDLLDVDGNQHVGLTDLEWLLRSASIFEKSESEVTRKAQLLCTAAGAKGFDEHISKESFAEILERFPNIIFPKLMI